MQVRLLACEPEDNRVAEAMRVATEDGGLHFVDLGVRRKNKTSLRSDPYEPALRALRRGAIDTVVAGASIALSEFLPLVFSTFNTSRGENLLYSAAPIDRSPGTSFLLVDPCVITSPEPAELVLMAEGASKLYKALYAKEDPFVAVLSHATGSYQLHRDSRAHSAVEALKLSGRVDVSEVILQLDAALSVDAARRKAAHTTKRPNVLVCTDIGMANVIYKTIGIFGGTSVHLSGAIMMGLSKGLIGLLPRTCKTEEVIRLFANLGRALRGLTDR